MMRLLKLFFYTLPILLVLLVLVIIIAPMVIPGSVMKKFAASQASNALDRDVRIDGDFELSVFPATKIVAEGVHIGNADWGKADDFVAIEKVDLRVDAASLLTGKLVVNEATVTKPVIALERNTDGTENWVFGDNEDRNKKKKKKDKKNDHDDDKDREKRSDKDDDDDKKGDGFLDIVLGNVGLTDGLVTLVDHSGGEVLRAESIDIAVSLDSENTPLTITGDAIVNGQAADLSVMVEDPAAMAEGGGSAFTANLNHALLALNASGDVDPDNEAVSAAASVTSDDLRGLAALAGTEINLPEGAVETLNLNIEADAGPQRIEISSLTGKFDAIEFTGDAIVSLENAVPEAVANLNIPLLDLTSYAPADSTSDGEQAAEPAEDAATSDTTAQGWPTDTIEIPEMPVLMDATVSVDQLIIDELTAESIKVTANTMRDRGSVIIHPITFSEGTIAANADLLLGGSALQVETSGKIDNVESLPLLRTFAQFDSIQGKMNTQWNITSGGSSVDEIMKGLEGALALKFADGALRNFNIAGAVRSLTGQGGDGEARNTDFAEIGGNFAIQGGIATTDNFVVLAPLMRAGMTGSIDVGQQMLDLKVEPEAVASLEGQGGALDAAGLTVPLSVTGSWQDPQIEADLAGLAEGLLKDPDAVLNQLKELSGDSSLGDAAGSLLNGLTGGGDDSGEGAGGSGVGAIVNGLTGGGDDNGESAGGSGVGAIVNGLTGGGDDNGESAGGSGVGAIVNGLTGSGDDNGESAGGSGVGAIVNGLTGGGDDSGEDNSVGAIVNGLINGGSDEGGTAGSLLNGVTTSEDASATVSDDTAASGATEAASEVTEATDSASETAADAVSDAATTEDVASSLSEAADAVVEEATEAEASTETDDADATSSKTNLGSTSAEDILKGFGLGN